VKGKCAASHSPKKTQHNADRLNLVMRYRCFELSPQLFRVKSYQAQKCFLNGDALARVGRSTRRLLTCLSR